MINTTKLWYEKLTIINYLLLPLSFIWWLITHIRKLHFRVYNAKQLFVICVGNANIGGSGKTPTCIFLGKMLKKTIWLQ